MQSQTFYLDNYDVVQGEYFSYGSEPILTFNPVRNFIYVNSACLKRLPNMEYALITISASEKRLSILPCSTGERHAVRLRSVGKHPNKPRHIRCRADFADKLVSLMDWNRESRYKILGYVATGDNSTIIAFDLQSAEKLLPGKCIAEAPVQTVDRFGSTLKEQRENPLIRTIERDTEIMMKELEGCSDDGAC